MSYVFLERCVNQLCHQCCHECESHSVLENLNNGKHESTSKFCLFNTYSTRLFPRPDIYCSYIYIYMYMFPQPFGSRNFGSFASIVLSCNIIESCTRYLERHATMTRITEIQTVLFSWVLTLVMFKQKTKN